MLTRAVLFLSMAASLAACVDLPERALSSRAVDPTSPLGRSIREADAAAAVAAYPDIAAIPSIPADVRSEAEWRAAAGAVVAEGEGLESWRASNPPELTDPDAFAAATRAAVGLDAATLPPAPTPEESAAYARAQRERATPRD